MNRRLSFFAAGVVCALLSVVLAAVLMAHIYSIQPAMADPGAPDPGTVAGIATRTFPTTKLTGLVTQTHTVNVFDPVIGTVKFYQSADLFVSVDVTGSSAITITPQLSADGQTWADAYYNSILSNAIARTKYTWTWNADTADYARMPIAGEYLRFAITYSGNVTPTIKVTLRNN